MLEDMEALFSLENNPGNVPDTGSNCFCFPDIKSTVMGLRTLADEKRINSTKKKEKIGDVFDPQKPSGILFEPSSLHKYSSGMREMKLEYFFESNEDEVAHSSRLLPSVSTLNYNNNYYNSHNSSFKSIRSNFNSNNSFGDLPNHYGTTSVTEITKKTINNNHNYDSNKNIYDKYQDGKKINTSNHPRTDFIDMNEIENKDRNGDKNNKNNKNIDNGKNSGGDLHGNDVFYLNSRGNDDDIGSANNQKFSLSNPDYLQSKSVNTKIRAIQINSRQNNTNDNGNHNDYMNNDNDSNNYNNSNFNNGSTNQTNKLQVRVSKSGGRVSLIPEMIPSPTPR